VVTAARCRDILLVVAQASSAGPHVPPPGRPLPPSIRFASGLVASQAVLGLVLGMVVLLLAGGAAVALRASWMLGAGIAVVGCALLGIFGLLLAAAVGLRRLHPSARPVILGIEWLTILSGGLVAVRGGLGAGAGAVVLGCVVVAAVSTPAARRAIAAGPRRAGRARPGPATTLGPVGTSTVARRVPQGARIPGTASTPPGGTPALAPRGASVPAPSWWELVGFGLPRSEQHGPGSLAAGDGPG
jgi:hypothetical protein